MQTFTKNTSIPTSPVNTGTQDAVTAANVSAERKNPPVKKTVEPTKRQSDSNEKQNAIAEKAIAEKTAKFEASTADRNQVAAYIADQVAIITGAEKTRGLTVSASIQLALEALYEFSLANPKKGVKTLLADIVNCSSYERTRLVSVVTDFWQVKINNKGELSEVTTNKNVAKPVCLKASRPSAFPKQWHKVALADADAPRAAAVFADVNAAVKTLAEKIANQQKTVVKLALKSPALAGVPNDTLAQSLGVDVSIVDAIAVKIGAQRISRATSSITQRGDIEDIEDARADAEIGALLTANVLEGAGIPDHS